MLVIIFFNFISGNNYYGSFHLYNLGEDEVNKIISELKALGSRELLPVIVPEKRLFRYFKRHLEMALLRLERVAFSINESALEGIWKEVK